MALIGKRFQRRASAQAEQLDVCHVARAENRRGCRRARDLRCAAKTCRPGWRNLESGARWQPSSLPLSVSPSATCDMDDPASNASGGSTGGPVPKAVASRLSLYLRELQHLIAQGEETTSSSQFGSSLVSPTPRFARIWPTLAILAIRASATAATNWSQRSKGSWGPTSNGIAVLVGAGNLGRALLGYKGFGRQGFASPRPSTPIPQGRITDRRRGGIAPRRPARSSPRRTASDWASSPCRPAGAGCSESTGGGGRRRNPQLAPVTIELPDSVSQVGVDLAIELEQLSFAIVSRGDSQAS